MRVCGVADAWIFCGFSRDTWIYPWMRPYPTNKAKAKNGPLRRIRWDERPCVRISFCAHETTHPRHPGDIGDIGDISRKPLKLLDFLNVHGGDISGDIFGDGDFRTQDTLRVRCTGRFDGIDESAQNCHSEAHSMGRTSGNRGECPARVLRAQDTLACAPNRSIRCYRGTPIAKGPNSGGVRTPGHPVW